MQEAAGSGCAQPCLSPVAATWTLKLAGVLDRTLIRSLHNTCRITTFGTATVPGKTNTLRYADTTMFVPRQIATRNARNRVCASTATLREETCGPGPSCMCIGPYVLADDLVGSAAAAYEIRPARAMSGIPRAIASFSLSSM